MITCKEDLINTYIENDKGELRDLYIALMWKYGIKSCWDDGCFGYLHDKVFIAVMDEFDKSGHAEWDNDKFNTTGLKKLTISDFKPQKPTRTEYVKVTESIFDLKEEFEKGELFRYYGDGEYKKINEEADLTARFNAGTLYRRIEKEVDWHEEVRVFLSKCKELSDEASLWQALVPASCESDREFDDEFLEMCRVALRANGDLQ